MKVLAFVSAILAFSIGYSAQAIIQLPGTFAPSMCGYQALSHGAELEYDVQQLCFGEIVGEPGEAGIPAVAFRLNNNEVRVYRIIDRVSLLMVTLSGKTQSIFHLESFDGHRAVMKVVLAGGKIESAAGLLDGIEYFVSEFEPILVIQRLNTQALGQ